MKSWLISVLVFSLTLAAAVSPAAEYEQVAGLMDVRTTFSDGAYDVDVLAKMARERGFGVLILNDHDRMAMEYGVPPLRNLTKKKVELNSINKNGANSYLAATEDAGKKTPGLVIIPGSLSSPFYYWTGRVFGGDLTANNHERRILTVGLENPGDFETLPILHNGFSTKYLSMAGLEIALFAAAFAAGAILIVWGGYYRFFGIAIAILSFVFLVNSNPFRTTPFDPYHGDQGIAPHQLLIDDVSAKGGMSFWNYPETKSGVRKLGPIYVRTEPYPWVLQESSDYTGFAALYGDAVTITEPGNLWDRVLLEYCKGYRKQPAWGIAASDYHKEGDAGETLGNFQTVFLLKEKSKKGVYEALRKGRMYAYRGTYPRAARLDEFSVSTEGGAGTRALSGEEIVLKGRATVRVALSSTEPTDKTVKVRLIRSGELVKTFEGTLPMGVAYEDSYFEPGERIFFRLDMDGYGTLVSNPIFVTYEMEMTK